MGSFKLNGKYYINQVQRTHVSVVNVLWSWEHNRLDRYSTANLRDNDIEK